MKTSAFFLLILAFSPTAPALDFVGMAAGAPAPSTLGMVLQPEVPPVPPAPPTPEAPPNAAFEIVDVDLDALSPIPIFGGYSNVKSDANHVNFLEPICRFLGFNSVERATVNWNQRDRLTEVMVFTVGREAYGYRMVLQSNEHIGLVKRLSCANRKESK